MSSDEPRNAYWLRRTFNAGLILLGVVIFSLGSLLFIDEERVAVGAVELVVGAVLLAIAVAALWYGRKGYSYFRHD